MSENITDLDPSAIIPLFEISDFNLLAPTETLYFCNFVGVSFEGREYQSIPCSGEGYDLIGQGSIPNPTLTVSNVGKVISNFLYQIKNNSDYRLEGCEVKRRVTQKRFLDGQPDANAAIREFMPDIYLLEQVAEETFQAVKFRLSTPFDLEGMSLPSRMVLRSCGWLYRGEECGYLGPAYDLQNNPTLDPTKDVCPKTLTGCEVRQGKNGVLTFGGFPGVGNFS